jgi:hypothetical protein
MDGDYTRWGGAGKIATMLAQLVDLDPMGLLMLAMVIGLPVGLVVVTAFAIVADFRHRKSAEYDGHAFPVEPKSDSSANDT